MTGRLFDVLALMGAVTALLAASALVRQRHLPRKRPGRLAFATSVLLLTAALLAGIVTTAMAEPLAASGLAHSLTLLGATILLVGSLVSVSGRDRAPADDATVDPLTQVATHRAFQDRLLHECDRAARFGDSFALLLIDLDQFQLLNNRYGHPSGDRMLLELAQRLRCLVRDIDLCARFGGDQFAVILPHTLEHAGMRTAERLRHTVAAWTFLTPGAQEVRLTASVGLAFYPEDGRTAPDLVDAAKRSVHFAKSLGGNQVQLSRDLRDEEATDPLLQPSRSNHGTIVRSLAAAVDVRDRYTHSHSNLVSELSAATARRMGLRGAEVGRIRVGGLLHDVGKIGIPDAVLSKAGPLSDQEWDIVRRHPVLGKRIIEQAPELRDLIPMVLHHQERYDGSGYPDQLSGEEIPLPARIIAAADAYHAIRSDRPYRPGRSHHEAIQELLDCAGSQFDPQVVSALVVVLQADEALQDAFATPQPLRPRRITDMLSVSSPFSLGGTA